MIDEERDLIESAFPLLKGSRDYTITSEPSFVYNCLAWAVGDSNKWWDVHERCVGYYWYPGVRREYTLETWQEIFGILGFKVCEDSSFEDGYEKVAIYMHANEPSHAARQLKNGRWTSKLGQSHDIEHATPALLEGDAYGSVVLIMKRARADWN